MNASEDMSARPMISVNLARGRRGCALGSTSSSSRRSLQASSSSSRSDADTRSPRAILVPCAFICECAVRRRCSRRTRRRDHVHSIFRYRRTSLKWRKRRLHTSPSTVSSGPPALPHTKTCTRIDTQVRVYSERRAGTVPYSAQTCAPRRGARERARSTGPVACVVLTFTRMRTDQPLRRTVDGGLTHRRGSQGSGHPIPDPARHVRGFEPAQIKHIRYHL